MIRHITTASAGLIALTLAGTGIAAGPSADEWEIGPIIRGRNYSQGMPLRPEATRAGPSFAIPAAGEGHVHYVTVPTAPLEGARQITLTYRIDAAPGTRFLPVEDPEREATLSLYFQRAGDGWTKRQPDWRWYAPKTSVMPLTPGKHTVTIRLDDEWISMVGAPASSDRQGFAAALAQTERVGFVFGSAYYRGHGVYATAPARFTVLDFRVN